MSVFPDVVTRYFKKGETGEDVCPQLQQPFDLLERIHSQFFSQNLTGPGAVIASAADLLSAERQRVLAGCALVFSGVFPLGTHSSETREAALLRRMGGRVDAEVCPWSTHVIARHPGTAKVATGVALARGAP
jgi:hypothetical protein